MKRKLNLIIIWVALIGIPLALSVILVINSSLYGTNAVIGF